VADSPWFWSARDGGVALGFTQRAGGASTGPYSGLNLGLHVGDDERRVRRNRDVVVDALVALSGRRPSDVVPVFMTQVHGAEVRVVESVAEARSPCDGVVTTEPGVALFSLVADCTPVLLYDSEASVVAAVHAGRPGMLAGVVPRAVETMRDLGARRISAVVGPSVCGRCYEVPEDMRSEAAAVEPVSAAVTWSGTPAVDVAAGVVEQLRRGQVTVTWVPGCTMQDDSLFSFRRDGLTGRFAGVVMLGAVPSADADDSSGVR
jgi:polyphenol oxidase